MFFVHFWMLTFSDCLKNIVLPDFRGGAADPPRS